MSKAIQRMALYLQKATILARAGVSFQSILLFPFRQHFLRKQKELYLANGISLTCPAREPLVALFEEVWINCCYDSEGFKAAANSFVVDVGAHCGVFAVRAATRYSSAKVLALEPSSQSYDYLCANVLRNKLQNVTCAQLAVGGSLGEGVLYCRGVAALNTIYRRDNYGSSFSTLEPIRMLTLDEVFQEYSVSVCSLLKLDCEGSEYEILFNASKNTLSRVERIAMEYHVGLNQHQPKVLEEFLVRHGFVVRRMPLLDEESGYMYARRSSSVL